MGEDHIKRLKVNLTKYDQLSVVYYRRKHIENRNYFAVCRVVSYGIMPPGTPRNRKI
jgi:hypothetical protein